MNPSVSIITVCRNAHAGLRMTADSIDRQSCRDFEWIIVDGASTDETPHYLRQLTALWIRWISEEDEGIYDAMNKGLRMARGEYVWFVNAGDTLYDEHALARVARDIPEVDIIFGEVTIIGSDGRDLGIRSEGTPHRLPRNLEKDQFQMGMVVSHQAFVARRTIVPTFNSARYRFSADLDWMLRILDQERISQNSGLLATVQREGATSENWVSSQYERFHILKRHFGLGVSLFNHIIILVRRVRHGLREGLWK